jgi:hypothetical protein
LLLKGPAIARWLYSEPSERSYVDIDLLIDPDAFDLAERGLVELGFESMNAGLQAEPLASHHTVWARRGVNSATVELHRSLCLVLAPPSLVWARLCAGARLMRVADAAVPTPGPAASALIIGLHAAQHGAHAAQPLRDLQLALERVDPQTWRAAAALARELGAGSAFALGLSLDSRGRELVERLGLSADGASRLTRLMAITPPATAVGVERMIAASGARARAGLLWRELVPSPAFMRVWQPLARRGWWGLVAAYLWRPFWLAARLPRGIRTWLRVARTTSDQQSHP